MTAVEWFIYTNSDDSGKGNEKYWNPLPRYTKEYQKLPKFLIKDELIFLEIIE